MDENTIVQALLGENTGGKLMLDQILNQHFSEVHLLQNIQPNYMAYFVLGLASMLMLPKVQRRHDIEHVFLATYPKLEACKLIIFTSKASAESKEGSENPQNDVALHVRTFFFDKLNNDSPRLLSNSEMAQMMLTLKNYATSIASERYRAVLQPIPYPTSEHEDELFRTRAAMEGSDESRMVNDVFQTLSSQLSTCRKTFKEYLVSNLKIYKTTFDDDDEEGIYQRKIFTFTEILDADDFSHKKFRTRMSKDIPVSRASLWYPVEVDFSRTQQMSTPTRNRIIMVSKEKISTSRQTYPVNFLAAERSFTAMYDALAFSETRPSTVDSIRYLCETAGHDIQNSLYNSIVTLTSLKVLHGMLSVTGKTAFTHAALLILSHEFHFELSVVQAAARYYTNQFRREFFLTLNFQLDDIVQKGTAIPVTFVNAVHENMGVPLYDLPYKHHSLYGKSAWIFNTVHSYWIVRLEIEIGSLKRFNDGDIDLISIIHYLKLNRPSKAITQMRRLLKTVKSPNFEHQFSETNYISRYILGRLISEARRKIDEVSIAASQDGSIKYFLKTSKSDISSSKNVMLVFHENGFVESDYIDWPKVEESSNINAYQNYDTAVLHVYQRYVHSPNDFYDTSHKLDFIEYTYDFAVDFQTDIFNKDLWKPVESMSNIDLMNSLQNNELEITEQMLLKPFQSHKNLIEDSHYNLKAFLDGLFYTSGDGVARNILSLRKEYTTAQYTILFDPELAIEASEICDRLVRLNVNKNSVETTSVFGASHYERTVLGRKTKLITLNFKMINDDLINEFKIREYGKLGMLALLQKNRHHSPESVDFFNFILIKRTEKFDGKLFTRNILDDSCGLGE